MVAFAHTMFALLQNPNIINKKNSTFSGNATNNNETLDIEIKSNTNYKDNNDNPFSGFLTSVEAAYFWTSGNWVQRDIFDFWAIDIFSILASVLFVTILQNMFIAFMGSKERKTSFIKI
ncbi:hypothetical protein C1645_831241 [Glomus cerebriforme]|uniref:Ion transport domain-containing protein n=1 Tax=Glomus cerebriforme TaxID=658196 RepID=A0A397SGH9_9GLOM|nr:hypothetical protein C1645_831241 [Glomus cerebriforme]